MKPRRHTGAALFAQLVGRPRAPPALCPPRLLLSDASPIPRRLAFPARGPGLEPPQATKQLHDSEARANATLPFHRGRWLDLRTALPFFDHDLHAQELPDGPALGSVRSETPKSHVELEHVAVTEPSALLAGHRARASWASWDEQKLAVSLRSSPNASGSTCPALDRPAGQRSPGSEQRSRLARGRLDREFTPTPASVFMVSALGTISHRGFRRVAWSGVWMKRIAHPDCVHAAGRRSAALSMPTVGSGGVSDFFGGDSTDGDSVAAGGAAGGVSLAAPPPHARANAERTNVEPNRRGQQPSARAMEARR
jgi:hypothetical protein